MLASELELCRLCGDSNLPVIFDLGLQALAGRFPAANEPDVPKAPLRLMKCRACGLVQLGHNIDPDELYRSNYGYRSGINMTMRNHLAGISGRAAALTNLGAGDTVLDIGSNDGTLLKSYEVAGISRVGIDPTIAQYQDYYPEDVLTVADFFSAERFCAVSPTAKARVVTSIAMFYDLPDPNSFVADIAVILAEDGIWVFEQSDLGSMLKAQSFDTVCHEHLEYWALRQIKKVVEAQGLRIFDVELNGCNGGSARVFACHQDGSYPTNETAVSAAEKREQELGLDQLETFEVFRRNAEDVRTRLRALLEAETAKGRSIHIYGASTKGNVLLQYCGIDHSLVDAAADRNPRKWGCRTPGTNIPIISEEESRAAKPNYFLVLPWHFRVEFVEREADFIAAGGKLIFPLPEIEIYPSP